MELLVAQKCLTPTNMEISILGSDRKADLALILDFVERWNKQDKESNVSEAASRLSHLLNDEPETI